MSRLRSRAAGLQLLRLLAVLATTLAAAVLLAAPASAHAALIRTDPANGAVLAHAPDEVRLTFNEPVRLTGEAVRLFDAGGEPATVAAVVAAKAVVVDLPGNLGDGTHVLSWRVISYDGHPLSGNLTFSIGSASPGAVAVPTSDDADDTTRIGGVVQGFQYVGLLLAAGLVVFTVLLPPGAPRAACSRLLRVMRAAALVAAGAGIGLVALASAQGLRPGLLGRESVAALLVAVGLLGAVLACRRLPARGARVLALLGAALALTAPALVGHTRSFGPEALLVAVDVTHLVTGALWFGGLVGLALTLRLLAGHGDLGARVLSRFSTLAAGSLVVLVAMGSLLSWRILASWENLFTTTYGALLLTKIAIVVVAVLVASVNRFMLLPRVRADARTDDGRAPRTRPIRTAVAAEGALLAVALLVTGFLSGQAPHPTDVPVMSAAPASRTATVGDVRVEVSLASGVVGLNTLRLETRPSAHGHHGEAEAPVVRLSSEDLDLGTVPLEQTSPTTYEASVVLPEEGVWDVQVGIRLDEFENPISTVEFDVAAPGEARG